MRKEKETQIENSSIKSHKMNQKEGNSRNKLKLISVDKMDNFCKIKLLNLTQQETGKLNTLISIKGNEFLNVKHSHRGNSKFRWYHFRNQFSSVQFSGSVVSDSLQPHGLQHARHPCPSPILELTQTHVHWVSDAIQPSHPLSSPSPPALNLSQYQGLFQRVSSLHQVAKVWSFSFSISPSNEYSGVISFRMDWLDFLAVQGTLNTTVQKRQFFSSQLSL